MAAYFSLLRMPARHFSLLLSQYSLVNIPALIAVNIGLTMLLNWLSLPALHPLSLIFIILIVISAMMCVQTSKMAIEFRDGNRTDLCVKFTVLHNKDWDPNQSPIPKELDIHKLSQGTWFGSLMITVFVLCHFLIMINAESGSVVHWLCIHSLLMVSLLVDFEMVEHLAAHSRNGVLVRVQDRNPKAWLLIAIEYIRIYFVGRCIIRRHDATS